MIVSTRVYSQRFFRAIFDCLVHACHFEFEFRLFRGIQARRCHHGFGPGLAVRSAAETERALSWTACSTSPPIRGPPAARCGPKLEQRVWGWPVAATLSCRQKQRSAWKKIPHVPMSEKDVSRSGRRRNRKQKRENRKTAAPRGNTRAVVADAFFVSDTMVAHGLQLQAHGVHVDNPFLSQHYTLKLTCSILDSGPKNYFVFQC